MCGVSFSSSSLSLAMQVLEGLCAFMAFEFKHEIIQLNINIPKGYDDAKLSGVLVCGVAWRGMMHFDLCILKYTG